MKKLLLALCFFCTLQSIAGTHNKDVVTVQHHAYTSIFNTAKHIPVYVTYTLRSTMLSCSTPIARTNQFKSDPEVPGTSLTKDYKGSGYDQGHNMPAQNNICNLTDMQECFYYSNMFPQTPNLNRGIWKKLEIKERKEAQQSDSVHVWIGSIGCYEKIGIDSVVVPDSCWKVIYNYQVRAYECYVFPNRDNVAGALIDYLRPVAYMKKISGLSFSP